jgi:hypothetical protein
MAALTGERDTAKNHRHYVLNWKLKGNVKGYNGGGACVAADGYLVRASDTAGLKTIGRLNQSFDTTATGPKGLLADGVESVDVENGVFKFATSGGNAVVQADVGNLIAEWLDDQTVVKAAGTTNHIKAGLVVGIDADGGIWIDTNRLA